MLEVHPPERTPHTWRDFFIHIATIVVGLVIAVGLEQTVEAIHHRHERSELRESLHRESEQILKDSRPPPPSSTTRTGSLAASTR